MKRQTLDAFCKKHPLLALLGGSSRSGSAGIFSACSLLEALSKYGIGEYPITTQDYGIFRDKEILKAFVEFDAHNPSGSRLLDNITVSQRVSVDSCSDDFDSIYRSISDNINCINRFQDELNIAVCLDVRLEAFDSGKAVSLADFAVNNGIDHIDYVFEFPPINPGLASSLISGIEKFCAASVMKDQRVRLLNFPFCFIPAEKYKFLYRDAVEMLKSRVFVQQKTLDELKNKEFACFSPCERCRCRLPCYNYTSIGRFQEYAPYLSPKTQSTVVLAGGSLPEEERYADKDIVYTTPAEQGDMFMSIAEGFRNILILDGYFYSKFPCTTFEVMLALENGINVFGASSIGALRAVELDNYGMAGMGYVYEYLKKLEIKPYHIVAQTYDENDMPVTVPLVDIIYFLQQALRAGVIKKEEFYICFNAADDIHFTLLSFKYFFSRLKVRKHIPAEVIARLERYLSHKGAKSFDIKNKDAVLLLNEFRGVLKGRGRGYARRAFNRAKNKYLGILYGKYRRSHDLSLPQGWRAFSSRKKSGKRNTRDNRECSAEETCESARKFFRGLDVVIAETTKYDPANSFILNIFFIPFYFLRYTPSCSTGNGDIFQEALACAYMELVERIPLYEFDIRALSRGRINGDTFPLREIPQYYNYGVSPGRKIKRFNELGYVRVTDILAGRGTYIPRAAALAIDSGTDGNASGNSLPEAILYGIYELIERDTERVYEQGIPLHLKSKLVIDPAEIKDKRCKAVLEQFQANGCSIRLLYLANIYDIPCVRVYIYDSNSKTERHGTVAARSDFNSAVYAAVHEAYMLYITYFVGTRDDYRPLYSRVARYRYSQAQRMFFKDKGPNKLTVATAKFNSIGEELDHVINKLASAGIRHIIVANTSPHDNYGVKSIKVIIPGLELIAIRQFDPSPFYHQKAARTAGLIGKIAG